MCSWQYAYRPVSGQRRLQQQQEEVIGHLMVP
jgi:hypothetical protein